MSYISSPAPSNRQIPLGPLSGGYARKPRRQARLGALLAGYFASTAPQTRAIPLGANLAGRRKVLRYTGLGRLAQIVSTGDESAGLNTSLTPSQIVSGDIPTSGTYLAPIGPNLPDVNPAIPYAVSGMTSGSSLSSWLSQQSLINGISNGLIAGGAAFLLLLVAMGGKKR